MHDHDTTPCYAFGHVELDRQARAWFGTTGGSLYVERILSWGREYATRGWPLATPWYLIRSLDHLAIRIPWQSRTGVGVLLDLASDERAGLLRRRLGHQQPLFDSINAAIALLRQQTPSDMRAIFRLAVIESDSRVLGPRVHAEVLVALATTGRVALATELARSSNDDAALGEVAAALVKHDPDRALDLARSITSAGPRAKALADLAAALHRVDLADEAFQLTQALVRQEQWRGAVAAALVEVNPDQALELAGRVTDERRRAEAFRKIAIGLAEHYPDRAVDLARSITQDGRRAKALADVASILRRSDVADEALLVARSISDDAGPQVLGDVVASLARVDPDRALELASTITDDVGRAMAIEGIAVVLARHDLKRALDLSGAVIHDLSRAKVISIIASVIAQVDPEQALHFGPLDRGRLVARVHAGEACPRSQTARRCR